MLPSSAMEGLNELPARVAGPDDLHEELLERFAVIEGRSSHRRKRS